MKHNTSIILALSLLICSVSAMGAETRSLTLEQCHQLALENNKQTQIDKEELAAATYLKKAALAGYFPKVSANGGYMYTQKNLFLLPDTYDFSFGTVNADGTFQFADDAFQTKHFNYADFREAFPELDEKLSEWVANEYENARNYSELDIHHVFVGQVGVTQPIFTGGKITELYKIARSTENIAQLRLSKQDAELLTNVDEAYWRVISVEQKDTLATKYCQMLRKVEQDLTTAVAEGTATQADLLKVRVKLNEAEVSLAKAENGLQLSKMALCQLVGLPLDTEVNLDDSELNNLSLSATEQPNMEDIYNKRQELQLLQEAENIAHSGVMLTASGLMPNVVAHAQYITTNPNLFNGYRDNRNFKGTFQAGVVVNIPIAHADDIYRVKAAKHQAHSLELKLEEAKEKIELQTTQSVQQLSEANRKLTMATANINNAEENLRMAQAAFDEGMLTSTELLAAQTAWLKAYSEKIDAAIEVRLYETYLKKNTGNL